MLSSIYFLIICGVLIRCGTVQSFSTTRNRQWKSKTASLSSSSLSRASGPRPLKHSTWGKNSRERVSALFSTKEIDTTADAKSLKNHQSNIDVSFSHVHLYVDHVEDVAVYKELEDKLNNDMDSFVVKPSQPFAPQNRDIVKQLIAGLGFRVTGARFPSDTTATNTRSVLVTSKDSEGAQFVVTAVDPNSNVEKDEIHHFDASNVRQFYNAHASRQGIAVLAFLTNSVDTIEARYRQFHPRLIRNSYCYEKGVKVLEVFAYYKGDTKESEVDEGTVLRFVEAGDEKRCALPGITSLHAHFDRHCQAAYCDHWVSNVNSRTGFLKTLADTLEFGSKEDFNAGVVAAGEAQIESTVTGNTSPLLTTDKMAALKDQSQVYLPINNALSEVGHVNGFLNELGQGVQHIASRVEDLISFVQSGNDYRKLTGEGFTFLNIPRSYYGTLSAIQLQDSDCGVSMSCAEAIVAACEGFQITSPDGAVDLDATFESVSEVLRSNLQSPILDEYLSKEDDVVGTILRSRYVNLYNLLRDHISEESYLGLVRNQILVDVQGDDLLYQIFTSNILQRNAGEESPFLEFIQRVCSDSKDEAGCSAQLKPGCGGFGIRNFLTLFLSIEVSKAMMDVADAKAAGDEDRRAHAQAMVDCFTDQLNESNPILTEISDAMTEEGRCRDQMEQSKNDEEARTYKNKMDAAAAAKQAGNEKLMACSAKYKNLMRAIREGQGI